MSNTITERQNEEKSLAMLAAQRQIYSDLKMYGYIKMIFSLLIPFALSLFELVLKGNTVLPILTYFASILSLIISWCVYRAEGNKQELAAYIQLKFDVYVFMMPWKQNLFPQQRDVKTEIANYSQKIISDAEQKAGLINWYDSAAKNTLRPELKGIYDCQHENLRWDYDLRRRFKTAGTIVSISLILIIILLSLIFKGGTTTVLLRFSFIAPILVWMLDLAKVLDADMKRLEELKARFAKDEPDNMEELQTIEYDLYRHRKSCYLIPDRFYQLLRKKDTNTSQKIADL